MNHPATINGIDANATGNHEQRGSGAGIGVGIESNKSTDNLVGESEREFTLPPLTVRHTQLASNGNLRFFPPPLRVGFRSVLH